MQSSTPAQHMTSLPPPCSAPRLSFFWPCASHTAPPTPGTSASSLRLSAVVVVHPPHSPKKQQGSIVRGAGVRFRPRGGVLSAGRYSSLRLGLWRGEGERTTGQNQASIRHSSVQCSKRVEHTQYLRGREKKAMNLI